MAKRKGGLSAVCFEYRVICPDEAPQNPSELIGLLMFMENGEYHTSYSQSLNGIGVSLK